MDLSSLRRALLAIAAVIALAGLLLVAAGAFGLGRLPGDIVVHRGNFRLYAPIATCLLVSVLVTIVLTILSRRQ